MNKIAKKNLKSKRNYKYMHLRVSEITDTLEVHNTE